MPSAQALPPRQQPFRRASALPKKNQYTTKPGHSERRTHRAPVLHEGRKSANIHARSGSSREFRNREWLCIFSREHQLTLVPPRSQSLRLWFSQPCLVLSLRVEGGQIADVAPDASGVRAFRGIPYAAPPVGELRWKAPHPIEAWDGVRTAAEWGPRCVQSNRSVS